MRNAFANELEKIASVDERVILLSGDIGNRLFDSYKTRFPTRFYNCGVAEANMASMAGGLAMCGMRPITYTITPFNTTRCLEQIRNDICYHKQPVIIVGVGAGLSYAQLGCTHHSCEDISFLRSLPNMTVLCPGDAIELRTLFRQALTLEGPVYLRIGKKGEPVVSKDVSQLKIGKGLTVREGKEVCLITTGNMLPTALEVGENIDAQVVSFPTVKPLDEELLHTLFQIFEYIVSLEEHSLIGGLGASLAEWMVDRQIVHTGFIRMGTPDLFPHAFGSQDYLRACYELDAPSITRRIHQFLKQKELVCTPKQPS
ncbi:MAG: transketolase C-terminal domain-containing protein [Candidatus Neptunochlamydia sp.]|nr:transketolase C-terminal domain-containing protein [Candidatus Neptunochlamydia sp.]